MGCCSSSEVADKRNSVAKKRNPLTINEDGVVAESKVAEGENPYGLQRRPEASWKKDDEFDEKGFPEGEQTSGFLPEEKSLHILHFNDIHDFDPLGKDDYETAAQFVTYIKSVSEEIETKYKVRPLILFSGDFIGPSILSTVTRGAHMVELLNLCKVDFGTFGRHDFYYGYPSLMKQLAGEGELASEKFKAKLVDKKAKKRSVRDAQAKDDNLGIRSNVQWVMDNIFDGRTKEPLGLLRGFKSANASTTVNERDAQGNFTGRRVVGEPVHIGVAILALADDFIPQCTQLEEDELRYEDYTVAAKRSVQFALDSDVEAIIALTHTDLKQDFLLSLEVPDINVILGGYETESRADVVNRIIKSGRDFKLSHVKLTYKSGQKHPTIAVKRLTMEAGIIPDTECMLMFEKYQRVVRVKLKEKVFHSQASLLDARYEAVTYGDSELAKFICDVCADDFSIQEGNQRADICILQANIFISDVQIMEGPITMRHIFEIFKKTTAIVVVKLTGEEVVKTLEMGAQEYATRRNCSDLCHVSSTVSYKILVPEGRELSREGGRSQISESLDEQSDTRKPGKVKVMNVMYKQKPIVMTDLYTVAMSDFHLKSSPWLADVLKNPEERVIVSDTYALLIQDIIFMYFERYRRQRAYEPVDSTDKAKSRRITLMIPDEEVTVCNGCRILI